MSNYVVSVSPHIRDNSSTRRIMADVLIALIPAFIASIYIFGPRAALVTCVCVASCVIFEWGYVKIIRKNSIKAVSDLSACITGVLLAFNLPVTIPLWQAVFGCFVAIVLVKQLFGGLGKNFVNPAITARVVMFIAFAVPMTHWVSPEAGVGAVTWLSPTSVDAITAATPLPLIWRGETDLLPSLWHMFVGVRGGCLGETSNLALLIGGIYLLIRRVITWHVPVTYIVLVFLFTAALGYDPVYQILAGGLFIGAIFMATDYVTIPLTNRGRLVFGVGCAFFTVVFRVFSSYPEGVSFAILLMNILAHYINLAMETKPLGGIKK